MSDFDDRTRELEEWLEKEATPTADYPPIPWWYWGWCLLAVLAVVVLDYFGLVERG